MLKLIGYGCTLIGCAGLGLCLRQSLQDRLGAIRNAVLILGGFEQEIHYHSATFREACRTMSTRIQEPYRDILTEVSLTEEDRTGRAFREVWQESIAKYKSRLQLPDSVYELFYHLFDNSYVNPETQMEQITEGREKIEKILRDEEAEADNKGKMYVSLGFAAGLLGIIILL